MDWPQYTAELVTTGLGGMKMMLYTKMSVAFGFGLFLVLLLLHIFFVAFLLFETAFLCLSISLARAVLELALKTRLALNSEIHLSLYPKCWD